MGEIQDLGLKYIPPYADNIVEYVNVSIINRTSVASVKGKCKLGYPYYDSYEDASKELNRYNTCKDEKCGI